MNVDWSMVGAIAGVIAVLLVVIIEADRLFARLEAISEYLGAVILVVFIGTPLLALGAVALTGLARLFVELPPGLAQVERSALVLLLGWVGLVSLIAGPILLFAADDGDSIWLRLFWGLGVTACGIIVLYALITGKWLAWLPAA